MDNKSNVFEEYQNLRRKNPDLYYKSSTQRQMYQDQVKLGSSFYCSRGDKNDT